MSVDAWSVTEAVTAAEAGAITAAGMVRRCADAQVARNLRAFTQVDVGAALAEASLADRRASEERLPLRGVVLAVKDNIDAAGFATTAGTPALRAHRPRGDAPVVRALREAGAVVLGKSNMHELAYGVTSNNAVFGRVRHPLIPERIAGGSSGGSAAAVAAGMATAALGTETGCSVRCPAALCGLVGFRPTVGAYSSAGVVPVSWTRDTIGVLATDVAGVRVLDAVIRSAPAPDAAHQRGIQGLRLVAPRTFRQGMTAALSASFDARLSALEDAGVQIVESALPDGISELVVNCGLPIALYETPRGIDRYLQSHGTDLRFRDIAAQVASPDVARLLVPLVEVRVTEDAYQTAHIHRARLDQALSGYLASCRVDGIIVPTTPVTAPRLLTDDQLDIAGNLTPAFPLLVRNADASSILGWPAITLPATRDEIGLPFGIDLQFPPGTDSALLAVAQACEEIWRETRHR